MGAKATRELHCASVTLCGVFESLIFKCTASGSLSLSLSLSHTDTHKHTHTHTERVTDKGKITEMRRGFSVRRGPVMPGDFVTVHGLPAGAECSLKVPGGGGDEEAAGGWLWAGPQESDLSVWCRVCPVKLRWLLLTLCVSCHLLVHRHAFKTQPTSGDQDIIGCHK